MRTTKLLSEYALEFLLEVTIGAVDFVRVEVEYIVSWDLVKALK
jgi:hypothetical protein